MAAGTGSRATAPAEHRETDINPKTGNIVVILRVVVLLFFVEKTLEKKRKKG